MARKKETEKGSKTHIKNKKGEKRNMEREPEEIEFHLFGISNEA